jgi:hypothetical protein
MVLVPTKLGFQRQGRQPASRVPAIQLPGISFSVKNLRQCERSTHKQILAFKTTLRSLSLVVTIAEAAEALCGLAALLRRKMTY